LKTVCQVVALWNCGFNPVLNLSQDSPQVLLLLPEIAGEPGNPVMFSAEVREQILAGNANIGCRQWRAAHPEAVAIFRTDNWRFKVDVDTEEDIARFERDTGHALRWPAALVLPT
jgi:CTP:molybdopterin cytidylyltransferase MocA